MDLSILIVAAQVEVIGPFPQRYDSLGSSNVVDVALPATMCAIVGSKHSETSDWVSENIPVLIILQPVRADNAHNRRHPRRRDVC